MKNKVYLNNDQRAQELARRLDAGKVQPREEDEAELRQILETYSVLQAASRLTEEGSNVDELVFARNLQDELVQHHRNTKRKGCAWYFERYFYKPKALSFVMSCCTLLVLLLGGLLWEHVSSLRGEQERQLEEALHNRRGISPQYSSRFIGEDAIIVRDGDTVVWVWRKNLSVVELLPVASSAYKVKFNFSDHRQSHYLVRDSDGTLSSPSFLIVPSDPDIAAGLITIENRSSDSATLIGCSDIHDNASSPVVLKPYEKRRISCP